MTCSLTLVCFKSIFADFFNNTSAKSKYSARTVTFLANSKAIWDFLASWIVTLNPRELTCTIKAPIFSSNAAFANFFQLINLTRWVVGKTFSVVYVLQVSFFSANWMSPLLRIRKNMSRTTFMLISACKKVSWNN